MNSPKQKKKVVKAWIVCDMELMEDNWLLQKKIILYATEYLAKKQLRAGTKAARVTITL